MAYGKNKEREDWLMRASPVGGGRISLAKRDFLFDLRRQMLRLMREMRRRENSRSGQ